MFDEQDRQYFYNEFKSNGYEVGSYDDFKKDLNNKEDRDWYYNEAKNMGYDVGTQADFDKMVLEPAASASPSTGGGKQVVASAHASKPQMAQPVAKPKTEYLQEVLDAYNSPDNKPGNFKDLAQLNDEYQRGELKKPSLISQALGMMPKVDAGNIGREQKMGGMIANMLLGDNMQQPQQTQQPQDNNQQVQQPAQQEASPESKEENPVTAPTSVVNNEGLLDAKLANYLENWKQRPDKQGTYFENMVADLLADGTANSNEEAVNMVESALGRYANRSAMDVTNQVVASLPDDTVQDAERSIEAQWYSHGVQDKLKQEADSMGISYDDYVGQFLKPAMVQSLVNKYGPNYRDIAEGIATRLYSHDEHVQDRLMNQDINEALSSVINKYVNPSVVDEYNKAQEAGSKAFTEGMEGSQFIPANLRLGTALGAQYEANEAKDPAKVLSSLQKKFGKLYRNPEFLNDMSNAAFKVMQRYGLNGGMSGDPKQFKPMINSVLKNELDQLEIKGMMPKGSAEYIMKTGLGNTIVGKITRKAVQTDYQNWLEDMANQQYQPGFWENVASGALTFAGDAWSYWLPGAAGGKLTNSMIAKAEGKLAGDLMAKGMERKVAERAAKVLIGKSKDMALKNGAVHGAVTFGGQSAISKPIDEVYRTGQFDENGKIYNPSVGKVIANTLGEVTKQTAVGAIMQGGTIANMIGKGRGLATNILADVGGKVVDSGIMTGQQILERMAHDPNFKPTGKDAAESFLESMANLTAIGLPGMVGKYARFKDAREFNKKFDFTDQDIAELKRFGYDGLRDTFEKVGIGEYAVEGENAQRLDGQLTQKYMDLMNDKSVPEVLKAKMMAVVEGKRPSSFSPVVDSIIVQPMDHDGKVYLETLNKDGGIIYRQEYSSLAEAQKADKKLEYEKTLGLASVLEGEFHNEFTQEHLDGLYNKAAQKYNMGEKLTDEDKAAVYLHQNAGAIKDIMDKQQKGIILTEEEQKQVDTYRHYYDSALENSSVMREFVNTFEDSHGVARGTLRKALESKDKKYAPLVESYLKELYNSIELKREMKQTVDDLYNTAHGNEQKRIEQSGVEGEKPAAPVEGAAPVDGSAGGQESPVSSGPSPYQDRTNSVPSPSDEESAANLANSSAEVPPTEPPTPPVEGETASNESKSDAYVMGQNAYQKGDAEGLKAIDHNDDVSKARLKRAFADDEAQMNVVVKAYEDGKDMEQFVAQRANSLTPAQQDAVRKYVEAQDAKNGVYDALQHADDGYGEALKEQLWPYQTEDGNIVPATLTTGQQVFLKKANEYGGGFVVVPGEDGNPTIKQVSSADIKEVGTPIPMDDYINQKFAEQVDARYKQFFAQYDGSGLKPSDTVEVAMESGDEPMQMTFAGYSEDGKIVLSDGKDNIALSKDEFNAWRQNALDASIGAELDAEDAQRANDDAAKAEAEKQERYKKGIFGYAAGQPDYSSKDTEPKVAAEYLQEQYGEDHGKLLNLVNGSRDDIKTQLANKKKAAAEYQNWLDTNADLDPEKAKKVENDLALVNEQIADLDARFKNWNAIRNSVMTPDEVKAMKEERKAEVEKAGVDETAIVPSDDFHVLVLDDKELKKQYPTMDEANDYITSQRKDIYHTQEDVEHKMNYVNDMLEQYINGETELDPTQLMELNTTKAQLEALQTNLSVAAKGLKAQANKLSKLYKTEVSQQEMKELGMTPSEQRKALVADALKKNDLGEIKEIYKDSSVDVTDLTPQTLEEAVSESLRPHSLNPESLQYELGKSNFKFGIGKGYDSNKFNYLIAKKGTGMSVNDFAVKVYNDLPVNLQDMGYTDQDVRNSLLDMFKSYDSVKEMRNVALMNRIAAAEDELSSEEEYYEAQKEREIIDRQAENPDYYAYLEDNSVPLPTENELNQIAGMEYDRMMEIEDREREYKQYVKSILPELADYDDRSNEEGYGGGSSLDSDSSRRGVDEGNRNRQEGGSREASAETEAGALHNSTGEGRQEISSLASGEGSADRTPHLPQETSFGERLKSAIAKTETEPTEAQKKAGNYKKGHLSFGGYDYTVETPKGVTRSGKDEQGKPWSVTMHDTYGYILGKIGVDGDHIDMFINDAADLDTFDGNVYVVDQVNPETGEFDEHKVMYGYPSEEAATEAYLANYSKGWKGLGKVTSVPKATFDKWLESSDRKTKPFADYAMVQKEQRAAYEEEMMQDGAHSEAFDKIVDLAKEQKEYWDLMEQGEVDPNEVPEVDVAHEMDELLKTLSDEEFKEVSDVLWNMDEEFEYWTANEHERREDLAERKNAAAYSEFLKQETKSIAPFADALRNAVNGGDKKAIAKAQKELTDALLASNLGHGYLSGQLEYAKSAKKKDESYSERRAFIKPLTDAINAIESALDSALADVGLEGVHVDFKEYGYGWIYADKGSDWRDRLEPLDNDYRNVSQYSDVNPISVLPQITMNNVKKVAGIIKSRIEEGERYNSDENQDENIEEAKKAKDNLPFHRDVKEVDPSEMTEAQKVAYDVVSTMLKKAGIPVKVVSNEDMEKVAEAQDNLNLDMLLNQPEMRFKIKTPEEKQAAENAYNFAKELRPDKWKQYAVVDMSNPNKMPEYFEKQELARKERSYYNKLMWGNYKVFNLDKSFEDNVAGLTGSFPSEFDPYKIDEQTNKRNELKKQIKETEEAYKLTGQERKEYQNQLMKEYMDEHGLASENDIPDDVWSDLDEKAHEKYQDKLDSLFAKYKDLDRQLKAVAEPGVQYLKGKGVVYGYTDGKEIVLNQEHLNANTPIHEYQHLWRTAAKKMNPELIEHGDKLIMQTQLFADLKEDPNYKHLSDDEICDEAFARLTGEDGAAILEQMANDAIKENPLDTAKELTIINRLKNWLKKFWYWTLDTFTKWKPEDIKKMTLEDIRNLVLRDLENGVDPRTVLNEKKAKKDDKTLAGVHNITEEKLRKALKLGGLANPSLAVIDTSKSAHDNFGEISFIAPSALVDKRTGKTGGTWITDAYTQRYPSVERQMSEKGSQKFEDWVDSLEYPSAAKAEIKRQTKDVLEDNGIPAWELMYLKEKGIDIKAYDSNVDYRWKEIINKYPTVDDILNSMQNDPELNEDVTSLAKYQIVKPTRDKISLEVRRQIYKETGVKTAPISPKVRKKVNEIFDRDYKSTLLDKDGKPKPEDVKKVVEQMVKEHNDTKKYDFYLSKVKASNYVNKNGLYADYIRWQENKLDEFGTKNRIFRGYKKDGSRKYVPETLENVSKAMREEADGQTNGGEYTSFGSFIAKLASRVDSTSEMRANKEKLSSNKDKEEFYEKWQDVYYDLAKTLYNDVFYGEQRLHDIVSQPDPKKYAKKEYGITLTPSFMKKLDSLKNAVQNELKSAYFETKFNRPVHLNEFVAAVVPNDLGEDVRKGLEESGLSLFDYDPEKEGDRSRAFNEAINSNNEIRFHRVTEPEELERLNKEKTFRMYSGMQELDGKLYSPMAAIIDGKRTDATEIGAWMRADERPDLVKNGKFQLVKTDKNPGAGEGPVRAAYNPYMHTSTSMMNDQFTGAYARGNIKVVEWEIPESEKTSGYRAEGAKDAVGLVPWHSGSVNGLLPKDRQRSVMLSRWRKAVRVVPDSEVAESIAEQLDGTGLAIPWNVVTPNQLRELVKLGVPITTDESGQQAPETKEKFLAQMEELKKEFPQAQFVDVKMTKEAFKEWGSKGIVKSPVLEQKLQKHPDSLMKAGTYFSGGGLVEEGLKGIIDPVVAVEYDRKISGVYRNNFGQHIVTADVRDVDPKELVKHIDGEVEYFHASPVCKNYSQAKSNGGEVELDKETAKSTADFIDAVKPRVVTIENVKGYKDSEAMKIITKALDKNGYKWDADVYNAADFGGYTSRERLIVRAVKDGELPEKPKKQPRKGGWLEAVEDILPTLTEKKNGVAPWMDTRLKADGIDWKKVEKPLYVMGSAYADGKIPHAYGDEILPTLRTKSGDVIIMPGGKVLRADGRVLARITGLGDDYLLPKTESLAHTIIGNGIPVQLTKGVIAPLLNKDDLSGRNVLARLGSSIFKNNWDADMQKQVSDRVVNTANKLGGAEATVYTSVDEVPDAYLSDVKNGATGWYDPTTHTVHVYLPNCADANEAERTVLHEKIGHEGMEVLLGGENEVRKFANFVYRSASKDVRGKIIDFANKYDPDWKNNDRMNVGTQEYIAHLAEEGFETAEDFSLWTKIKHYLIKVLKKLGVRVPGLLNDKDLRYYLMKAGKALHVWDDMPQEKQEALMKQASNAEIKDALSDGAGKGKPRQKKGESAIQYMKRVMEWKRWKEAREDENDPEPPMFYDFDKDADGKKEWERLNKEWRDSHHLQGDEMPIKPERKEGETDEAFFTRYKEWEKWNDAMADKENPMPDMFSFEKQKQDEARQKYEDWLTRHELNEQNDADLDLYEGKIYPAETNPEADALEQRVMQDLAEVTSTDVSKEGAAKTVKHAVIHRRKNMEEASADDAIYINDVKNRIEKMADSGAFDKLLSDYKGKPNRAEKLAEAIPYIIEAPRRLRDLAHDLNATGAFDKGHIHIQPDDVEAIQPFVEDLIAETSKKHTVLKDDKEVEVYDDPQAVSDVASKMAQAINANHQGDEGFVPIDGTDILSEHVLPLVKQQIVPDGIDYKNLSPEMKAAIDSIRDWYNYTYDWLKDNRTLREDTGYNADYVNHIWDKEKSDKQAYAMYVENRQRTKSPNEKPRTISTLMEGISVGLVPKTTDITKMMAYYSRSNIEAWVNKTMLQELSGLNVIERNEDGEIVSSDPLLSSTPPFNLEQYQYFEIPGVGPVWVYNVSPKQVKVKNPITGKEKVLYSEASAGDRFGVVFETYQSSPFWKAFDTLASSAKKLELGFSGFHAGALTEVYMVQNMAEFGPKKAMANFMKYIFVDTMKNHQLPCFANPEDFQEAATHLVKFGATNDYAAADVQNMFDNMRDAMMKVQEKLKDGNGISGTVALATMPLKVATQMLSLINKGMDRALWDFLHDGLKLATYRMRADKTKERAKKKGWNEEELSRALDEDGQFVNDMFGGQHWDILGASNRTLRYAGRVLLSPDWNASTTRHFLALTGYGSIWNEATFENFKHYYKRLGHGILTPEDEGRRSRQISSLLCYGIGFMVFYEAIANGINAAFRAMDEEKEREKAEEIRKTNPSYRSPYELAYPDGMKWYDYLMRGNSLGQQSKIYLGRYADGTEMYIRHGKLFREVPEYLFNHKGELEFPGPMVQRMIGKANPMVRMTLDDINYLSDFQASHADQEIQRKYGKTIGLLYKDALYWAPFLIPSQENKEFKAVDFFFPSSKGFSPWKAQSYFKDFILSGDMEGVVMTYQSCQRNGIDPEAQIKAAIGSVKALESAEMSDGVTSLQEASKRFDAAKSITEKKKMRQKMKKFLSQSEYKAFTQKEALDMVQGYLNGDEDLKEMEKAENKYLMKAKSEDVTEDWRIQAVWNGTMETYDEYQRLKDVDKAKANAFKNSKTNKRLFAARKAISAAKKKMNKAKKQMDGTNDAAKLVEIRKTRKELLETLNGMD
jgi:site-specific DNA-cytosine methylase